MGSLMFRRQFLAIAASAAAAWAMPWMLAGCAAPNAESSSTAESSASDDASSGAPFDPSRFIVPDALGDTYQQALQKAQEAAPDALLFALRFSHVVTPGQAVNWDYMFASQKELKYYIVFTGDVTSVSELGDCTMKFAEWENVPSVDAITVDAAAAYQNVSEIASSMAEPDNLYAYLILYSEAADTAATEYSYVDEPLNWYFEFGFQDQTDNVEESESDDTLSSPAENDETALVVYAVDAETGETRCVTE